jgi:1,2-dihydroxy-3-keto-5-methylthiopentene dioxygenase
MAVVQIPDENKTIRDDDEITSCLAAVGIDYEKWEPAHPIASDAAPEDILRAYADDIEKLKARGGYVTADVIDVNSQTPGLEVMLAKFNREHWHDEDEVRFIISGRGRFDIHPRGGPVIAIEVEAGDLIRVPRGTLHWFNLCNDRQIRAIRLFQDSAGWAPNYTESGVDTKYLPVCLGASYIPAGL